MNILFKQCQVLYSGNHRWRVKVAQLASLRESRLVCEMCGAADGVKLEDSRTLYAWDGTGLDPNRPVNLCRACADQHHACWDSMWADYYSSLGV